MLDGNFGVSSSSENTNERRKRLLAVQAAVEIAKASVSASSEHPRSDRVEDSLKGAADKIEYLADAIQRALDK
ncbi:hypothetical protein [Candidatus Pantoea bituminis]|uniref:hypothetical protein n=1 Tax=Candidatus Pantoea bituminis TaxID=2831036 RepID=UPI001C0623C9|nr:hypothetical protein [Pantoea bituminis]